MNENQDHALVKIPPPVLLLLHVIAAFLMNWLIPLPAVMPGFMRWAGAFLVLGGLLLGFLAVRQFTLAGTTLDPHSPVRALVTDGPYRFTRNPIYLGFTCILIGLPLAFGTYWGILMSFVFIPLANYLVIQYEEAYLERKFGDQYAAYRAHVRRWL